MITISFLQSKLNWHIIEGAVGVCQKLDLMVLDQSFPGKRFCGVRQIIHYIRKIHMQSEYNCARGEGEEGEGIENADSGRS